VKLRFEGFQTVTRQQSLDQPIDTVERIWPAARELFRTADRSGTPIRLIGITMSSFGRDPEAQLGMFEEAGPPTDQRIAEAVDRLRKRFGRDSVQRAALLGE
jgi:DNA polymerase-4